MTVSVLIGWRSDDPARIRLWDHCRPLWEQAAGRVIQVCVADDGATDGPFSRAAAFNRAAAMATGDVFLTWGADHLPNQKAARAAARVAREQGWSFVFDSCVSYTADETDAILSGIDPATLHGQASHGDVPGILAVRRDVWEAVGGLDERFGAGYGYEDCALRNLLASRYGVHRSPGYTLACLYHDHGEAPAAVNSAVFWGEYAGLAPHLN